jgi:hypothetical protein
MSWLWKDKKTEQLKALLNANFDEAIKLTISKLTDLKDETNVFKSHVESAFASSTITASKLCSELWRVLKVNNFPNFERPHKIAHRNSFLDILGVVNRHLLKAFSNEMAPYPIILSEFI